MTALEYRLLKYALVEGGGGGGTLGGGVGRGVDAEGEVMLSRITSSTWIQFSFFLSI